MLRRLVFVLPILTAALGLIYRATWYHRIPVPHGQSYGLGDIIDGLFALLLVIVGAVAILVATWELAHKRSGLWLIGAAVLSYAAYFSLHAR